LKSRKNDEGGLFCDFLSLLEEPVELKDIPPHQPKKLTNRCIAGVGGKRCISSNSTVVRIFQEEQDGFDIIRHNFINDLQTTQPKTTSTPEELKPISVSNKRRDKKRLYPKNLGVRGIKGSSEPSHCHTRNKEILNIFEEPATHFEIISKLLEDLEETRNQK